MKIYSNIKYIGLVVVAITIFHQPTIRAQVNSIDARNVPVLNPVMNGNTQYPGEGKSIDLHVRWKTKISESAESFDNSVSAPLIIENIAFIPRVKSYAIDITTGNKVLFGSPEIKTFVKAKNSLALIADGDSTLLMDVVNGKVISKFIAQNTANTILVSGASFCIQQLRSLEKHSTYDGKTKPIWSIQDRNGKYYNIILYGEDVIAARSYYDFKKDSTMKSVVVINAKGVVTRRLDFLEDTPKLLLDGDFLFAYNENEIYKLDLKQWKIIWSRKEKIGAHMVLTNKYLRSPYAAMDKFTGEIVVKSNLDVDPSYIKYWAGYLLMRAFDGDEYQNFLVQGGDYTDVKSVKYAKHEFIGCINDEKNFPSLVFADYSMTNNTAGLMKCSDGVYIFGFNLDLRP